MASISFKDLPTIRCEKCDNKTFRQVVVLKKLSSLISPTGEEDILPIKVFICEKCGAICKDTLDDEILEDFKKEGIIRDIILT